MAKHFKLLSAFILCISMQVYGITWDEPWAEKVIKNATSFILAKVIANDEEKGVTIVVLKSVSGKHLQDTLVITNFYSLSICSNSGGHGPEFRMQIVDSVYLFLTQNIKGEYCIATPSTGFDYVSEGSVMATFRHSYHQAAVPARIYEPIMTAIFNNYHDLPYDKIFVEKFVQENLSKSPAGFSDEEIKTFFLQHVALESVYHLNLKVDEALLIQFLNNENFHNQVSAARALKHSQSAIGKQTLMNAISDSNKSDFVRVVSVWSLTALKPKELKAQLEIVAVSAPDKSDGFGGNIMDPRVCTNFPSLKSALQKLVDDL